MGRPTKWGELPARPAWLGYAGYGSPFQRIALATAAGARCSRHFGESCATAIVRSVCKRGCSDAAEKAPARKASITCEASDGVADRQPCQPCQKLPKPAIAIAEREETGLPDCLYGARRSQGICCQFAGKMPAFPADFAPVFCLFLWRRGRLKLVHQRGRQADGWGIVRADRPRSGRNDWRHWSGWTKCRKGGCFAHRWCRSVRRRDRESSRSTATHCSGSTWRGRTNCCR